MLLSGDVEGSLRVIEQRFPKVMRFVTFSFTLSRLPSLDRQRGGWMDADKQPNAMRCRVCSLASLMFDLHLLECVELVRAGKLLEALFVSRDKIHPLATSEKRVNTLKVCPLSFTAHSFDHRSSIIDHRSSSHMERRIATPSQTAMTAIACREPLDSPASFMFRESFRHEIALKASGAILEGLSLSLLLLLAAAAVLSLS